MDAPGLCRTILIQAPTLLRQLLARQLRQDPRFELIAETGDAAEGESRALELRPNLVILDVDLPHNDGIELARRLIRRLRRTRILALSQRRDPVGLNRLHEIGVHGFVEKEQSLEILEEALAEVAEGRSYFTAILCHTRDRLRADPQSFPKFLTGREQDILRQVLAGRTSKDIARLLSLSPRSIETFRYRMMRKLGVDNLAGLLEFAFRRGLLAPATAPPEYRPGLSSEPTLRTARKPGSHRRNPAERSR